MPFLTISGVTVPCALDRQQQQAPQELGDPGGPAFAGNWRRTVRGQLRTWQIVTPPLPRATADVVIAALENPDPITCTGDLIGGTTLCIGRLTSVSYLKRADGERVSVTFSLQDAEPWRPVLAYYRPGRPVAGLTHSRADGAPVATYYDRHGVLQTAAPGALRDDAWFYEASTGLRRRATLLEGGATNGWTFSAALDNVVWSKVRSSVTANAGAAPDGTTTASKLVEDASVVTTHYIYRDLPASATDDTDQTASFFARAAERTWIRVWTRGRDDVSRRGWVDLSTGQVSGVQDGLTVRVDPIRDGWYRVVATFPLGAGVGNPVVAVQLALDGATDIYTGDGASGIYLWGFQYEADAACASSYIPTAASTATRAADSFVQPVPASPQEMTVYLVGTELGAASLADSIKGIWGVSGFDARIGIWGSWKYAGGYRVESVNHKNEFVNSHNAVSFAYGDTFELVLHVFRDGSVRLGAAKNGGDFVDGDPSGVPASGLAPEWGVPTEYLGSAGPGRNGPVALRCRGIAPGILPLAQCRALWPEHEGVAA